MLQIVVYVLLMLILYVTDCGICVVDGDTLCYRLWHMVVGGDTLCYRV